MKTVLLSLLCTLIHFTVAYAEDSDLDNASPKVVHAVRGQLKKYAISHCIIQYSNKKTINEVAATAFWGYLELGFHHDEEAYNAIHKFTKSLNCKNNIVQCCLDAIETEEFSNLLKSQDKYASAPNENELREDQY